MRQDGKVIFNLTASFQRPTPGLAHQVPMPDLLPPEACVDFLETIAADPSVSEEAFDHMARRRAFELRNHRPAGATQHYQWFLVPAPIGAHPPIPPPFLSFPPPT